MRQLPILWLLCSSVQNCRYAYNNQRIFHSFTLRLILPTTLHEDTYRHHSSLHESRNSPSSLNRVQDLESAFGVLLTESYSQNLAFSGESFPPRGVHTMVWITEIHSWWWVQSCGRTYKWTGDGKAKAIQMSRMIVPAVNPSTTVAVPVARSKTTKSTRQFKARYLLSLA